MEKIDILYIKGKPSINNDLEMKYSLRSLERYVMDYGRIFITGECPEYIDQKKVVFTPADDIGTIREKRDNKNKQIKTLDIYRKYGYNSHRSKERNKNGNDRNRTNQEEVQGNQRTVRTGVRWEKRNYDKILREGEDTYTGVRSPNRTHLGKLLGFDEWHEKKRNGMN